MDIKNFINRVIVAVIGIPIIFYMIYLGNPFFLFLVTFIQVLSLHEFYQLARKKGFHPSKLLGFLGLFLINGLIHFNAIHLLNILIPAMIVIFLLYELFKGSPHAMANAGVSMLGMGYISLSSFLILIRDLPGRTGLSDSTGAYLVIMIFSVIWICDTAAYLFGANFGKHSLFKRVSPNKTWEGAVAGFIASVGLSVLFAFVAVKQLSISSAVIIGALIGVLGQISDLVESLFKRDAAQKDTSSLLPGHGGMLDRFDSPILIAPAVFAYLYYFTFQI